MKRKLILASSIILIASSIAGNIWAQSSMSNVPSSNPTSMQQPKHTAIPKDAMTLERAQILSIDKPNNTVVIVPSGKSSSVENQIRLIITPDTKIISGADNKPLTISDLEPGINIKVVHSSAFTKSIPPQTVAYSITLL
ncbi:MAG: hypothetical protein H9893_02125 [Candidatus Niameybacter stercoravium]|nr:hypothetical protein [Candidatus Niameybacter stercoravium]